MGPTTAPVAAPSSPIAALLAQLPKFPTLDPAAEIAVARQEGLSGGIGDNGTSFGPNQLHFGGAYPSWAPQGNPQLANAWAWSPQGIDYALRQAASVSGGLRGTPAIQAIVSRFERPANPSGEIARAIAAYGSNPPQQPLFPEHEGGQMRIPVPGEQGALFPEPDATIPESEGGTLRSPNLPEPSGKNAVASQLATPAKPGTSPLLKLALALLA